jgi:hypothetical protein
MGKIRFRGFRAAAITLVLAASVAALFADTVVDPQLAEFDPSPQHDELATDGTPLVQSYKLAFYETGVSTPFEIVNLGKPAPDPDGKIRVHFLSLLSTIPASGVTYEARVSAVGPGGTAASAPSNFFSFSSLCSPHLNASVMSVPSSGGTGSIGITAEESCSWIATSSANWLTITNGASGSGSGTIAFDVAANTGSARSGTITAAGKTFTVSQDGVACTFGLSPATTSVGPAAGSAALTMTTAAACSWNASSNSSWLTITGGGSGSGTGTITVGIAANTGSTSRTGSVTAGGKTFTVNQAGAPCTYALARSSQLVNGAGGEATASINTGDGCTWTATANVSWLSVISGASGTGAGIVGYRVEPNPTSSWRTGTLTIGGERFSVSQSGTSCTFTLGSTSQSMPAAGGAGAVSIDTGSTCFSSSSSQASWITITSGASGSGPRTVGFSVAPNPDTVDRVGTLTIAGQPFTVTQAAGAGCSYAVAPTSQIVTAAGGAATVGLTTGSACPWVSSSSVNWLTVTQGASGTGSATIGYSVEPNTGGSYRTGILTIGGQRFTVSQAGVGCTFELDATSLSMPAAGGTGTVTLTAPSGCFWLASSKVSWMTITSGTSGTGSRTFTFTVALNTAAGSRTGSLVIAGKTFTVTQAGQ